MKPFTILILAVSVCAAEIFTREQLQDLNDFVEDVMACSKLPGLTLTVVKGGEVFTKGYGKRDIENDKNTTADTLFCIGSLTKAMTTTLLAKLLPEKFPKSTWDTKMKDILGDSFKLTTAELTDHVTLRDILSHRTGLATGDVAIIAGYSTNISRSYMAKMLQYLPSFQPLRYQFKYNNWMYFLAGYVAEVLAREVESWEDLLSRHVLKPLRMNSTVVVKDLNELAEQTELALPYIFTNGVHKRFPSEIFSIYPQEPAGAVCSSADDMAKWIKFLLHSPKDIVDETVFDETMRPVQIVSSYGGRFRPLDPVDSYTYGYGMGWFSGAYRGRQQIRHGGGFFAYTSSLWLFPDHDIGVFVSVNGMNPTEASPLDVVVPYITDILLGEIPWLNSTTVCIPHNSQYNHTEQPEVNSQRPLSAYVGVYGNRLMDNMHIFINNTLDRLQFTLGDRLKAHLYPTHLSDIFRMEITGMFSFLPSFHSNRIHFSLNNNGQIDSLTASFSGELYTFRKDVRFGDTSSVSRPNLSRRILWAQFLFSFLFCFEQLMRNIS